MSLPAHLAHLDSLVDLVADIVADQIAREILAERDSPADCMELNDSAGAADACVERMLSLNLLRG
jgi:hypothetical protein